tara:strand:+ start:12307 stop:12489 length:183 start_codon:yes stop_codon:yes gene_type:complete
MWYLGEHKSPKLYAVQCQHSFTNNDKSSMQTLYNQNKEQNWQHAILPIIFVILVIALLFI